MKIYSIENTKRNKKYDNLYDLFYPMLVDKNLNNVKFKEYIVNDNREMRIDLICLDIYNSSDFIDELMHINDIINPYSIKKGDIIKYPPIDILTLIRNNYKEDLRNENKLEKDNKKLPTSIPNDNFMPIMIDKENREIKITNKLK